MKKDTVRKEKKKFQTDNQIVVTMYKACSKIPRVLTFTEEGILVFEIQSAQSFWMMFAFFAINWVNNLKVSIKSPILHFSV